MLGLYGINVQKFCDDYNKFIKQFLYEHIPIKLRLFITKDLNFSFEVHNIRYTVLLQSLENKKIDKVVGIESRGFLFGMLLAQELKAGFVPVRKPNKLPFSTMSASYTLEYGTDTLEIHTDSINPGDKVLIHDDVLATGGTAKAVCELVEKLGGEIVQLNFLMELHFLKGRDKLENKNIFAAITY
ncbi:adenine phosphoribosyltransferase [Flavobacterium croceum]|uniref:adenine phosphoribosyltransferase n=1 Tax=Flavobacterium croceum TaxID=370975 RepID=UPI0031F54DEE